MNGVEWKAVPGFPGYEATRDGRYRSVDRVTASGRRCKGQVLATRKSNRGYLLVDLRDPAGRKVTRSAHTVTLETWAGPCPPGQEARHLDDNPAHNRWDPDPAKTNLMWGTKEQNREDRRRNTPTAARPPRECVRCGQPFEGNGRRCHPCVKAIGREAAKLLKRGARLPDVAERLGYPSAEGVHNLAVRYGGYGKPWARRVADRAAALRKRLRPPPKGARRSSRAVTRADVPAHGRKPAPKAPEKRSGFRPNLGQTRQVLSREVTQSRTAERDRAPRKPGGVTRRSR
jgi:hypothetical protein